MTIMHNKYDRHIMNSERDAQIENGLHKRCHENWIPSEIFPHLLPRLGGAFDLRLAVSVPLPIVMGIFVLLWFQSRLT